MIDTLAAGFGYVQLNSSAPAKTLCPQAMEILTGVILGDLYNLN
ncbi:MAG: hypothetical protein ACU0CQ_04580 [Sulfitobacter sp.]